MTDIESAPVSLANVKQAFSVVEWTFLVGLVYGHDGFGGFITALCKSKILEFNIV